MAQDDDVRLKGLEGFKLEFMEGENGVINEGVFYQPKGTFKAAREIDAIMANKQSYEFTRMVTKIH